MNETHGILSAPIIVPTDVQTHVCLKVDQCQHISYENTTHSVVEFALTCSPVLVSDVRGRLEEREVSEAPVRDGGRLEGTGDSV